ncbi:MAG: hypothetical protein AAB367_02235 [Patescibacteria group bacterium]
MQIIFIRYGEWENAHINERGKKTMLSVAHKLEKFIHKPNASIIVADIPRAIESAAILSKELQLPEAKRTSELFAEEESGNLPNIEKAASVVLSASEHKNILIVIASREYLELLPNYILEKRNSEKASVQRGEILIVDIETNTLKTL